MLLVSVQIASVRNFYFLVLVSQTKILFLENRFHSPGHGGRPQLRLSRVLLSLHSPIHSLCLTLTSSKPHLASQILHGAHSVKPMLSASKEKSEVYKKLFRKKLGLELFVLSKVSGFKQTLIRFKITALDSKI